MTLVPLHARRRYAASLWFLLALFTFRVIAQPLALLVDAPLLPPFAVWHSGVVSYPLLFASQAAILFLLVKGARQVASGRPAIGRAKGFALVGFGVLYFASMALRLALGTTILREHPWFGRPLPTIFHLVLASYVLLFGYYQLRHATPR